MDFFYSIVTFFGTGGVFMYPILIVFAFGVAIAIERYITLSIVTNKNRVVWEKVQPLLTEGDFDEAREMTSSDDWERRQARSSRPPEPIEYPHLGDHSKARPENR